MNENVDCCGKYFVHPAKALQALRPDAVFIMMNPGSLKPLEKKFALLQYPDDTKLPGKIVETPLVKTKPDPAQYQIMQVMSCKKWKYVRVINLSDLREIKSKKIFSIYASGGVLQNATLFSQGRCAELKAVSAKKPIPIIAAWGLDWKLNPLAEKCLSALPNTRRVIGVQYCSLYAITPWQLFFLLFITFYNIL